MTIALFQRRSQEANFAELSPRRGIGQTFLLACPLAFTGFVAIYSRTYNDLYDLPAGTPAQDAQVMAYAPYVKHVKTLLGHNKTDYSREQLVNLARRWDQAVRQDVLQPLTPISFEDSIESGARGSILRAKSRLVTALMDDAKSLAKAGQTAKAVDETLLAMRISDSLKFSDFDTVYLCSTEQKHQTLLLSDLAGKMDEPTKEKVRSQLTQILAGSKDLDALTRASRIQYYDWMKRMSKDQISIEDVHRTALVTKAIINNPGSPDTIRYLRTEVISPAPDGSPEYLSELRLACKSEQNNQRALKALASSL